MRLVVNTPLRRSEYLDTNSLPAIHLAVMAVAVLCYLLRVADFIICPMRQQHWTDYKISLCVCQ